VLCAPTIREGVLVRYDLSNIRERSVSKLLNEISRYVRQVLEDAEISNKAPSYLIVRNAFADLIASEVISRDEKLPSERLLHETIGVSRSTLREALALLEAEGLLHRMDRRGWFVSAARVEYEPATLEGFHTFVGRQGHIPRTEVLDQQLVPVNEHTSQIFSAPRRGKLYLIKRRRYIDERPVVVEHIYLDPRRFPKLLEHNLNGSLSAVLEKTYGVRTTNADVTMYPSVLSGAVATQLHVSPSTPSLYISRVCRSKDQVVTEYNENFWHYSAIKLKLAVVRTRD